MSSAPLTPLPEERLEQDLAEAREQLSKAERNLEKALKAHERAENSTRTKKARKEVLHQQYVSAQQVHQQALATVHAAELAVENAAAPSPSKIQEALEGLLPHGQADGEADTAKTDADAEAKSAAEADATSAAEADATLAAEAAAKSEAEAEAAAKSEAAAEAAAKSKAEAEGCSEADADAKATVEAAAKPEAEAEAAAKLKVGAGAAAKSTVGTGATAKSKAEAGGRAKADVKPKKRPSKKVKTQTKGDGGDGSQEEPITKHLQDIAGADSDESDAVSAGSVKVGKKRKRKEAQIEGETHWRELIAEVTHRMQHDDTLSNTTLDELRKTKEHAEAQLELVKARTQDVDDQADSGTDSDDDKIDVEVRWAQSFSADDSINNKRFPDGGEAWRDTMIEKADLAVTNFLKSPTRKANRIPPKLRRLMRLVAEVVPRCATTSKELALHILTTQQGKIHCRFHEIKPYSKAAVPAGSGFLHCGCDEQAALWELFWFKTWTVASRNPKYTGFDRMGRDANDVLTARQRAFFSQAYSTGTLLQINDMYSATYDSVDHMTRLRRVQLERMLFTLNQSLPEDSEWEYALAKKTKIGVPVQ
ncbi:hypothetical protein B0H14DRAFT_3439677 [Mycena olivaceomarginata]|nr:hypothetical protein B0H14DRAFT_3439677 [Mycena olivaceomarginata]